MRSTNASPVLFGFDFQVNAAIVMMLENIKDLKKLRLEGATEDIELIMNNGKKIFAQAKAVVNASSDFSNVRSNAKKAIKTLSTADGEDVEKLILITNSVNPLNEETSKVFFYGPPTDIKYKDLPEGGQKVIDNIVNNLGVTLDKEKFHIKTFRFETDNPSERYKVVLQIIRDFLGHFENKVSATELMEIWQNDIFKNGTQTDVSIQIDKKGLVWPIIVLTVGHTAPQELLEDYDQGLIDEISLKYSELINNCTERYDLVTQVIYDYNQSTPDLSLTRRQRMQLFIDNYWQSYADALELVSLDSELQEGISKIVLSQILQQRFTIGAIKEAVSL